jgi:hypothetical protein
MPDHDLKRGRPPFAFSPPIIPLKTTLTPAPGAEAPTLCERCGAEMYRMHAVWRKSVISRRSSVIGDQSPVTVVSPGWG